MDTHDLPNTAPVFDAYLCAIRQAFGMEAWHDIERYAERVWNGCRMDSDPDWLSVRAQTEAAWPM